ncbi:MAG TPA: MFS transporter [Pseudolabrys sp.]|jgi:EmrB/QacA subfamily drug resistance transporter|nr:MFS transporter [Pseudolabrys sp.]
MAQLFVEPSCRGVIEAQPCPRALGREIAPHSRSIVLAACVLASSMAFIDGSALTVALPNLRASVGADLASVQWVLNGYVLALASLTLIGGALADSYGKARILAVGCLVFAAASIACAVAPSVKWLIAARVVQGIGAALLTPASLALIGATYPKEERNRAVGVWAAASALTTAGGPILGGWLTETFGWQAVFWINPPLAVAAVALLYAFAPPDAREPRGFDFAGAGLIAVALGALAWGLSQIGDQARAMQTTHVIIAIAIALIGFVAFAFWERTTGHPMTPPRLAQNRPFVGLNIATLLVYWGLALMFFLVPFDLIDRRALPPTQAGAVFLPFSLSVGLLSRPFGAIADAIGARTMLIAGPLAAALAFIWFAFGQQMPLIWGVIAPMILLGIGLAVLIAPLTASVLSSVAETDQGLASGLNNAASRVAQLAGVALAAGVGTLPSGYELGLLAAAALTVAGALMIALTAPKTPHPRK